MVPHDRPLRAGKRDSMCTSLAAGGRRCTSSHRAVRAAHRAVGSDLEDAVTEAGPVHPAAEEYFQALEYAEHTREAVEAGDDELAQQYAAQAREHADAARALLAGTADTEDEHHPREHAIAIDEHSPEHARAAAALAAATGVDDAVALPRDDDASSVAWSQAGFSGAATVFPDGEDGHPYAQVVFSDLDADRYGALQRSPWPYRAEGGRVVYENMPVDQAEQIIETARTGRPGRPWERHDLDAGGARYRLSNGEAAYLESESEAWADNLDPHQEEWTRTYTDEHYDEINEHLYRSRPMHEPVDGFRQPMSEIATHLDSAIAAAEPPDEPHLTYRGYTPPPDVLREDCVPQWARANYTVGRTYRDLSYMSVSHCPEVAVGFSNNFALTADGEPRRARHRVVFEVVTSKGAALAAVSEFDNDERERLLPRGATYRVVGIHDDVDVAGKNVVLIQLVDTDEITRH